MVGGEASSAARRRGGLGGSHSPRDAFERTHLGYFPLRVIISISLYFVSVEELVDGCQRCMQGLFGECLKRNESYITRMGRMCVLRGYSSTTAGERKEEETTEGERVQTPTFRGSAPVRSLIRQNRWAGPIRAEGKFISTADLYGFSTSQ